MEVDATELHSAILSIKNSPRGVALRYTIWQLRGYTVQGENVSSNKLFSSLT